jgi:hypothetical protein
MSTVDCSNQTNTATLNRIQFNDLATATNQLAPSKYRNKTTICASIDLLPTIVELSDKNFDEIDLKSNKKSVSIGTDTNSNSNIDSSQRLCRICQSDSGRLVRPCACSGTVLVFFLMKDLLNDYLQMADVHEHCLSMWLVKSKKRDQRCEICKDEYAISGKQLKPICQWIRPNLSSNVCVCISFQSTISIIDNMHSAHVYRSRLVQLVHIDTDRRTSNIRTHCDRSTDDPLYGCCPYR